MLGVFTLVLVATFSISTVGRDSQITGVYTGYEVMGPYQTLRIEGSWTVPMANCTATPNSVSNISVIIDGINGEGDSMEIGTYQDCISGLPSYGAFVNIYPMTGYFGEVGGNISDLAIEPGDVVDAQGTWRNCTEKPQNWNTNFVDETTNQSIDTNAMTSCTFQPVLDSGALILSSDGHTLTSLSPIQTGWYYTGVKYSDVTGPQKNDSTFGETANMSGYALVGLQMPGTLLGSLFYSGSSFEINESSSNTGTTVTSGSVSGINSTTTTSVRSSSSATTILTSQSSITSSYSIPPSTTNEATPSNMSYTFLAVGIAAIVVAAGFVSAVMYVRKR